MLQGPCTGKWDKPSSLVFILLKEKNIYEKKHGKRIISQHVSTGKRTWPWNHYIPEHPTPRKLNRQAGTDAESFNHPKKEGHISNVMCPVGEKILSSYSQMYSMQQSWPHAQTVFITE